MRQARDEQKADKGVGQRLADHINRVTLEPGGSRIERWSLVREPECYPFQLFVGGLHLAAVLEEEHGSRRDSRALPLLTLAQRAWQRDFIAIAFRIPSPSSDGFRATKFPVYNHQLALTIRSA